MKQLYLKGFFIVFWIFLSVFVGVAFAANVHTANCVNLVIIVLITLFLLGISIPLYRHLCRK